MDTPSRRKIEIWSDVVCPFCFIGKRELEAALADFPQRDAFEVEWRSFQLQPDVRTEPSQSALQHLALRKGWTLDETRQAMAGVTARARSVGLAFDYERAIVANTFDAHRLVHFAASLGRADALQEQLFRAYFIDGRNVGDPATLVALAGSAGLPMDAAGRVLASEEFAADVRRDIDHARRFGIHAVPFFVFDRRYAVSGAQDSAVFLQALSRTLQPSVGPA